MNFSEGDVVFLKSGSPPMTIAWIEGDEALCQWFDEKRNAKSERFYLTVLKKRDAE